MPATKTADKRGARIDARAAAQAAADYFKQLYPNVESFSLEELELSDDGGYWEITLGFDYGTVPPGGLYFMPPKTKYKVFKVNARTGEVVSMRIRKLE